MTNTATKVGDDIGGFVSAGTLYEVSPPVGGADYLVLFYAPPPNRLQDGKLVVMRATANGASSTRNIDPIAGTYLVSEEAADHATALWLAGKYVIVEAVEDVGDAS